MLRVGVLALQGAFAEHCALLETLGVRPIQVRLPEHLPGLNGLILPGGESTTFANLAAGYGLMIPLKKAAKKIPLMGTCAGLIFMADQVGTHQPTLGVMDIRVRRNAFGRQKDSFETSLVINEINGGPFFGVFIRAPVVEKTGPDVRPMARLDDGRIVGVRQGRLLGFCFHPELSGDDRLHRYFLTMMDSGIFI